MADYNTYVHSTEDVGRGLEVYAVGLRERNRSFSDVDITDNVISF